VGKHESHADGQMEKGGEVCGRKVLSTNWFQNSLLPSSSRTMSFEGRKGKCLAEVSITSPTGRFSIKLW
jgi:hypothetical protein